MVIFFMVMLAVNFHFVYNFRGKVFYAFICFTILGCRDHEGVVFTFTYLYNFRVKVAVADTPQHFITYLLTLST